MGTLDAPSVSQGLQPQRAVGSLLTKLASGIANCNLTVLGDSTGDGTTRWVFLVAQKIATAYPTHTVRYWHWNDTNLNYDPSGTGGSQAIQTGTAPPTVADTFARADSATLGNSDTGYPWALATGTIGITSNKATVTSNGAYATLSANYADHTGSVTVTLPASKGVYTSATGRVSSRTSTDTTYEVFLELLVTDSGSALNLYKRVNGTTVLFSHNTSPGLAYGGVYTVTWSVIGTAVSYTCNGITLTGTLDPINDDPKLFSGPSVAISNGSGTNHVGLSFSNLTVAPVAPAVDVYNASVSGQVSLHSVQYLPQQVPARPDTIVISYGHNEKSPDCRAAVYALIRDVREYFPRAALAVTLQNPRSPLPSATYSYLRGEGVHRVAVIAALASQEGVSVINVHQRFLAVPNYWTTLLNSDGLHPSDALGSPLWADEVWKYLSSAPLAPQTGGVIRPSRVFVPANAMSIAEGAPTLAVVNGSPAWQMPQGSQTSVVTVADVPGSWQTFNIYAIWDTAAATGYTGANNSTRWEMLLGSLLQPTGRVLPVNNGNDTVGPTALASQGQIVASLGNNGIPYTPHSTAWLALGITGRPLQVQIRRLSTDVLAANANLRGVLIERAS